MQLQIVLFVGAPRSGSRRRVSTASGSEPGSAGIPACGGRRSKQAEMPALPGGRLRAWERRHPCLRGTPKQAGRDACAPRRAVASVTRISTASGTDSVGASRNPILAPGHLEATCLCETRATRFIGHRISVTIHRVRVSGAAGLSGEREAAPRSQRLSRRQSELVRQSRRVAAMALQYLPTPDVVVLAAVV